LEPDFWIKRWQTDDIGFHRDDVHPALVEFWPQITSADGARVFVPLCGKSRDMRWLAERGHRVIGVELSAKAVDAFFEAEGLVPDVRREGAFAVKTAGAYELWCGDLFEFPADAAADASYVYDRASLVALPPEMRLRYARKLAEVLPPETGGLLISLAYDVSEMDGPPFSVPEEEVARLFGDSFTIDTLASRDALAGNLNLVKRGLTSLVETCYRLRRNS
jgi:thiopurine S-methyltransferase